MLSEVNSELMIFPDWMLQNYYKMTEPILYYTVGSLFQFAGSFFSVRPIFKRPAQEWTWPFSSSWLSSAFSCHSPLKLKVTFTYFKGRVGKFLLLKLQFLFSIYTLNTQCLLPNMLEECKMIIVNQFKSL